MSFERDLKKYGDGETRFGAGDRALYASDSSNYRHVPRGVFVPRTADAIVRAVEICARHGVPVVHRGGGTALAGQSIGTDALVIDSSKYCHTLIDIDPEKRLATVEPGCVLDDLRNAAKRHGLTFGPDPSTHNHCTLGGMIGNNSCGVHSVMAGRTLDNVHALDILTYDGMRMTVGETPVAALKDAFRRPGRVGEIYRALWQLQERYAEDIKRHTPAIPRLVSGYRLEQLLPENGFHVARALVGSESTCVTILRATLRLVPDPEKALIVAGFDSMAHAADAVPAILALRPVACEAMDHRLVEYMKKKDFHTDALKDLPDGRAWLLVEAPGDTADAARDNARRMTREMESLPHIVSCTIEDKPQQVRDLWEIRKSGLGATAWVPGMDRATWPGWEDSAVHPDKIGVYTRRLRALLDEYGYHASMYGHFGDGLIHMRVDFGLGNDTEVAHFDAFINDAAELVISLGGTLSGEHGDGQARSALLPKMYGDTMMTAFGTFKHIWDPRNKMNPGNIVAPRRITDDLRFGPAYRPDERQTVFRYPDDRRDFRRAAIRCVGVGECRRMDGGTMCPSYRATREEKHSTRGRARLLQEMLQGDPVQDGWRADSVRDALHLCLACKACKAECPVNVDMATYKAEFYHHYYAGRLRPAAHYAIGHIPALARLAALAPGLANFGSGLKWARSLIGIHPARAVPRFAARPFRRDWNGAPGQSGDGPRVLLWTDTFNNYFSPPVLHAAAALLARAGCRVDLVPQNICCGRPYYDFGMLDRARAHLRALMDHIAPLLDDNTWIVGIEPSCVAVFRDELCNMFPDDPRAALLKERTLMLSDFLLQKTAYNPPSVDGALMVHGHCHHKGVLGFDAERDLLLRTGADIDILDSGCCGMAGSFGYEKDKYTHSLAIAEQALLPAIRRKPPGTRLVANGFSCRSQIADLTGEHALTLPEILNAAHAKGETE